MSDANGCPECGREGTAETGMATLKRYDEAENTTYLCCRECGRAIAFTPGDAR